MPAVKIRARGVATPETPARKPAAKRSTAKATPAPAKRGPGRPRKDGSAPRPRKPTLSDRRSSAPQTDDKTMKRLLDAVEKAGARRKKAENEHKESVDALHAAASAALSGGVPMARVSDASGISRQWLYKMGEFRNRENGGEPETPKAAATKSTRKSTKSTARRSNSKAGARSRPVIKSR